MPNEAPPGWSRRTPGIDLVLARQRGNRMARNQIAHLPKHGMLSSRWPGRSALAGVRRVTALQLWVWHRPVRCRQTTPGQRSFGSPCDSLWDATVIVSNNLDVAGPDSCFFMRCRKNHARRFRL